MLAYPVLGHKERLGLVVAAALFGALLGLGFIGAANSLLSPLFAKLFAKFGWEGVRYIPILCFPALALFFHFSMRPPRMADKAPRAWAPAPWKSAPLAFSAALIFGMAIGSPATDYHPELSRAWLLLAIPLGEELLFRGWLWNLSLRVFRHRLFSFSNALPAAVVGVSIAFAFWHVQNFRYAPVPITCWQMLYSFFASVWLCSLRAQSLSAAVLAHATLNAMTLLGQRFSPF